MTTEETEVLYNEMLNHYTDLPNHIHHPEQFEALAKMFLYKKSKVSNTEVEVIDNQ